jgi:16S rRNA processing protein RimM
VARVVKTQGRRGEVAAELHSDFPERFQEGAHFLAVGKDGLRRTLKLQSSWPHKGQIVLKFEEIDSISGAEALVGCEVQIPASDRAKVEPGCAYVSDLVGCSVFNGEQEIGLVKDVQFGAGEAPLLQVKGVREYDIPFAEAFLKNVDVRGKRIEMVLPEGMLDVNAPMTAEEKEQQKKSGP